MTIHPIHPIHCTTERKARHIAAKRSQRYKIPQYVYHVTSGYYLVDLIKNEMSNETLIETYENQN